MSPAIIVRKTNQTLENVRLTIISGLITIKKDPQILIYPYIAVMIIFLTFPFVNTIAHSLWDKAATYQADFSLVDEAPHRVKVLLGLVTFYVFYTGLISTYFTCAVSASVLARLNGKPIGLLYGMRMVFDRFLRVTKFGLVAILFFPIGIIAERKRLLQPRGFVEVIGGAFSLQVAQLAPLILSDDKTVTETVRHSNKVLGRAWHESLVIKLIMYGCLALLAFFSFIPKIVEHHWFNSDSSHTAGWIAAILLGASSFIVIRVVGTVFTTTLYFNNKDN